MLEKLISRSLDKRLAFVLCFFFFIYIYISLCLLHQSEGEERLLHALEDSPPKWSVAEKQGNRSWGPGIDAVDSYSVCLRVPLSLLSVCVCFNYLLF